ncbi:MAG TPA: PAS-domain containing protein, partial [Acetobacteraceae bacterium]|nr:PAS-domain containing protein [Acetobacteraceae bacterium]
MNDRTSRRLRAGQAAILAGAAGLLALIWADTAGVIDAERKAAVDRAEVLVHDRALLLAAELDRQLAAVDQTLRILADEWRRDPAGFSVAEWRRRAALLASTSAVFRTDARGVVVESSLEHLVGRDIALTETFHEASAAKPDADRLFIGRAALGPITQEWQVSLLRPLRDTGQQFAGTIGIMDRIGLLTADFAIADLGPKSLAAVVGTDDGRVRAALGPASGLPDVSIADSGLFAALRQASSGIWCCLARPQGVARIYAFRNISAEPLSLVVGQERTQVLRSAGKPIRAAVHFALAITALVLLIALVLMIEFQWAVRRERRLGQDRAALARANAELWEARQSADRKATLLQSVIVGMSDGVLMLDSALRVTAWNQQFAELAGIPPGLPTAGMSMEQLLRAQAEAGEFGPVEVETEVARRMTLLRSGKAIGILQRSRPDGRVVELRRNPLPGGGFVT